MKFSEYILESRVDDFKVKYGRKFNQETLDKITNMVSPKFLDWVGKVLDMAVLNDNLGEYMSKIGPALDAFEKLSSNLPKTDINQYQSLEELLKVLNDYQNSFANKNNTISYLRIISKRYLFYNAAYLKSFSSSRFSSFFLSFYKSESNYFLSKLSISF
jgi:hypothetical protein